MVESPRSIGGSSVSSSPPARGMRRRRTARRRRPRLPTGRRARRSPPCRAGGMGRFRADRLEAGRERADEPRRDGQHRRRLGLSGVTDRAEIDGEQLAQDGLIDELPVVDERTLLGECERAEPAPVAAVAVDDHDLAGTTGAEQPTIERRELEQQLRLERDGDARAERGAGSAPSRRSAPRRRRGGPVRPHGGRPSRRAASPCRPEGARRAARASRREAGIPHRLGPAPPPRPGRSRGVVGSRCRTPARRSMRI